jgi:hypothetical protein
MGIFRKHKEPAGENDPFVTLIRVAQEDDEIRKRLFTILTQDRFNRVSILNSYLEEMRLKQAPAEFISAIACLLDDNIAQKALEVLQAAQ